MALRKIVLMIVYTTSSVVVNTYSLYVNDILFASNDIGLLHETKIFLSNKLEMKDLGDASFVPNIKISFSRYSWIITKVLYQ